MKISDTLGKIGRGTFADDRADKTRATHIELRDLKRKYKQLLDELAIGDRLVELAEKYVKSYPPVKTIGASKRHIHSGMRESGVLALGDSHVGQDVRKSQTLGFGNYNFSIFADRLKFVEERTRSIVSEHVIPAVDELVIFLLGDMLAGCLAHPKEIVSAMTLFDQFYSASFCFAQMIRNIAQDIPRIRVYTAVGNHTRMPHHTRKMPTEQRYSNFDHFLYAMIKQMLARQDNVEVYLDYQPFCYVDVKGTKILAMHGEHLVGGDSQMGIPIHAISRQISGLSQAYESKGIQAPHIWLMGHKHRPVELPTIKGEWLINGSFVGDDNYALTLAQSCEPMQLLFGIHPKYRKTWEYKLKLLHAKENKVLPYTLPPELHEMLV